MPTAPRTPTPTVVVLLPVELERFEHRPLVDGLLRADGVVAVDPPRAGYGGRWRWPAVLSAANAQRQARRLHRRLPGTVAAVVAFDPGQARLARELAARSPGCELFYGPPAGVDAGLETHLLAAERAAVVFDPGDPGPLRDAVADVLLGERP